MSYAELQTTSQFSFLRGASSPRELFEQAALFGITALAIVDRNSVAGLVRAHEAARESNVRLVVGCRLDIQDNISVLAYPTDKAAYGRLCRLLTIGKARAGKGGCHLAWSDLAEWSEGLLAVLLADEADAKLATDLGRLRATFGDRAYCALTRQFRPNDHVRLCAIEKLARAARVPTLATGDVLYHHPDRRMLQDVVTAIRLKTTVWELGLRRERHAHRHLKTPEEMRALFLRHPEAVGRTLEIVRRCRFSLDQLEYTYPTEVIEEGRTAQERLEALTWAGAAERYLEGLPDKIALQLRYELDLIERLGYAPYFLTVDSIVRFARSQNILCQGRGSAANSAVCYVLGITSIDPATSDLLFERFISEERDEPPDIDVDFEHDRREEVLQWVYDTYGRHRAALTAAVHTYHGKGAIGEVGKALGVPNDITAALSGLNWGWSDEGFTEWDLRELNLNPDDRRLKLTMELARELIGAPRHLSQHPGGFVLTLGRLDELVPIEPAAMENRQVIEWDKNDIDTMHMMKVDCLGLGMLGALRRCFDLLKVYKGIELDLASIPPEDRATYLMIQAGDTVGVFQIESRAQMAMLPRMKPMTFLDLVIEVAIVRPGPIQGNMVHPYIRRREGRERVVIPRPELEPVLGWTLGIPLFQEQAMMVAVAAAGFTKSEADQLRRAMGTFKFTAGVEKFQEKLISGMIANGYAPDFAHRMFKQLEGFGSYGFPLSHAASFARLAYASSYLKCHHPDVFACALLNAQPMGFYAAAQLVYDAKKHGVEVRPPDINHSDWDSTLEQTQGRYLAVRLGLRLVWGLPEKDAARIVARRDAAYVGIEDLWQRAEVGIGALEKLANADAFGSLGLSRREALWVIKGLSDKPLPLFAAADAREGTIRPELEETSVALPPMSYGREVVEDYRSTGLTLRDHPVAFVRRDLAAKGIVRCADLRRIPHGRMVTVAGLVLIRQRPGSAKGVMFLTIEDETEEVANLIIRPELFEKQRRVILSSGLMACRGQIQRQSGVTHVLADHLTDYTSLLHAVGGREEAFSMPAGRGDEARRGSGGSDSRGPTLRSKARDIYIPDLHIDHGAPEIQVRARNFH